MNVEDQKKFHEMQAYWWMHSASNGHSATRNIRQGGRDGRQLTADELRDDAMQKAQHHMHLFMQLAEK